MGALLPLSVKTAESSLNSNQISLMAAFCGGDGVRAGLCTGTKACLQIMPDVTEMESYMNNANLDSKQNFQEEDEDSQRIRWLLANNPNTPVKILDDLASVESPGLVERVADNPHTSSDTLSRLALHDNPRVRAAVAENPNLSEETMWRLARDIHPDVRLRLAEGYYLPRNILQALAEDDNPYVQSRARKTISRLNQPPNVIL